MKIYTPIYYKDFSCIAADCPDSCCKEWAVDIDTATAAYYRSLPGAMGDHLRAVLKNEDDGVIMSITEGRCPMWRQDGLCEIQAQLGHEALCETCRNFPRLRHDYGNFVELGLELSCPEAARLILNTPSQEMQMEELPGDIAVDYDPELMAILRRSRAEVLHFLGNTDYPLPQSLAIILLYAHSTQAEIDTGERVDFDPNGCLADARRYAGEGDISALIDFFQNLEILTPQWRSRLSAGPVSAPWTEHFRALTRYFIERYWLQTVSDYDLVCRVKFMIAACLLIHALGQDPVSTAQLFSKEIENDPENVEKILDGAYESQALTDINLIRLLLS